MAELAKTVQLEDAFRQRAYVMQKIERLRDVVHGLQHPTLVQLTKLRQDLWEAYHEHSRAHSCIVGHVPDEELPQQESEYDAFDQLFNEVGVPLEEKLIALRSATPSATDQVAHQQQPWKRSVPTLFRNSSWSTPTMTWESIRPELSGKTATQTPSSRTEILEPEVDSRIHSPPTSSPSSTSETRSRFQTLDADTALRSRMPPTNGPCCRSKPASPSDALEIEEVMRDHLPRTKPNPLSQLPVGDKFPSTTPTNGCREWLTTTSEPVDSMDLPVSVVPSDSSTEKRDVPPLPAPTHTEGCIDHDKQPKDTEETKFPTAPQERSNHEACRVIEDNGHKEDIDEKWFNRLDPATFRITTGIEPQLAPAAKPPDKKCQPIECCRQQSRPGNRTKQRVGTAAEECRYKVDASPKNPNQDSPDRSRAVENNCQPRIKILPATPKTTTSSRSESSPERNDPLPEVHTMLTAPQRISDQEDFHRAIPNGDTRMSKHKPLLALHPLDELDQASASRTQVATLLKIVEKDESPSRPRAEPNPQLPAAGKQNQLKEHWNSNSSALNGNKMKQRASLIAAEESRCKIDVSSMNPNSAIEPVRRESHSNPQLTRPRSVDIQQNDFVSAGDLVHAVLAVDGQQRIPGITRSSGREGFVRLSCRQKQKNPTRSTANRLNKVTKPRPRPRWIMKLLPLLNKLDPLPAQQNVCIRSRRVESGSARKMSVRTSEILGSQPYPNVTPRSWLPSRKSVTAEFVETTSTATMIENVSMNPFALHLCHEDTADRGTGPPTSDRDQYEQSSGDQPQDWTLERPPNKIKPSQFPRNHHSNDVSSHICQWPPRKSRTVGSRKPTNESEPAHRKCSVGKRKRTDERCRLSNPMMNPSSTNGTPGTNCVEKEPPREI